MSRVCASTYAEMAARLGPGVTMPAEVAGHPLSPEATFFVLMSGSIAPGLESDRVFEVRRGDPGQAFEALQTYGDTGALTQIGDIRIQFGTTPDQAGANGLPLILGFTPYS